VSKGPSSASAPERPADFAFQVCLDANVWISALIGAQKRGLSPPSAASRIVTAVWRMRACGQPLQLVVSHELVDTVVRVGTRLGHSPAMVAEWGASIIELSRAGPLQLDPALLLAGRDQLAMNDREDAGVLATCIAARAHLLVTDNLQDFVTNDSERIDTRKVGYQSGGTRQLFALIHDRRDEAALVVMHPIDAIEWLEGEVLPEAGTVRQKYRHSSC